MINAPVSPHPLLLRLDLLHSFHRHVSDILVFIFESFDKGIDSPRIAESPGNAASDKKLFIRDFGIPSIVVTHDLRDVVSIVDNGEPHGGGKVIQSGSTEEVFNAEPLAGAVMRS